jgi:FtsZ-binding cell division protein ZapB
MSDVTVVVGTIRSKVKKLVHAIHSLESEIEKLKEKQTDLLGTIENQKKLIEELKDNKNSILIADSIKQTDGSSDVKKRIDEMVREIDKCIELLNK